MFKFEELNEDVRVRKQRELNKMAQRAASINNKAPIRFIGRDLDVDSWLKVAQDLLDSAKEHPQLAKQFCELSDAALNLAAEIDSKEPPASRVA